jgi:murein DD-endopeptidase MepM/ murein hydrolase activator NlpD
MDGRPGKLVSASVNSKGQLDSLVARFAADDDEQGQPRFSRLSAERDADGHWQSHLEQLPLQATTRLASGTIRSSLFAATDEAGLPDAVAVQMAEMFSGEIDFHRELRKGDQFSVVYESLTADGEPINWNQGAGRVLAAEFTNNGKSYQAIWFGEGKGGYFDGRGESKRRAFLASPMEFSRVTSGFSMRFHPILQTWRAHLGVDYGAPTGTPVRSVGDGVVEFAGVQNGYGNVVQIHHAGERSTLYGHLSRIDVKKGQRIDQGQRIGAVGATGWATGPHLHFEFRVNGQHRDPLAIAKASETIKLEPAQRPRFALLARSAQTQLQLAQDLGGLPGRAE